MEKRILLAFLLSSIIFIGWQKIFPTTYQRPQAETIQVIENKQVIEKTDAVDAARLSVDDVGPVKASREEERVVLNNGKIEVELTTRGGAIERTRILGFDAVLPVTDVLKMPAFADLDYQIESRGRNQVVFTAKSRAIEIRKKFVLSDDDFLVSADTQVRNAGREALVFDSKVTAMALDMTMMDDAIEKSRDRNLLEYSVFSQDKVIRKTSAFKFTSKENKAITAPVDWFGFRDRYFCAIVKPEIPVSGYEIVSGNSDGKQLGLYAVLGEGPLAAGEMRSFQATIYVGPQNARILKQYESSFEKIQVYFKMAFMDAIAKIIEDLMILMHKLVRNWGVAIILVSLLIYFAMYPLTMKSMVSMRKMQNLQPKIVELRAKHEKSPEKLNQEIMKLYAENKVNPLGGCLPLLLQMPVFICLYQMIWRSILFKGSDFLWIKDLSEPDRLLVLNQSFPIIGNEINLLPVIILFLMVIQQKITAKNMVITDPNQLAQQKMMTFMMPVVLLLVFYRIASGLTLYLAVFYIMSSFTQWRVARIAKAAE